MAAYRLCLLLPLFSLFLMGCQPAKKEKPQALLGRSMGITSGARGQTQSTLWGQVTSSQGDQAFDDELYYLTYPVVGNSTSEPQLGYVSSSGTQNTGVWFWGNVGSASNPLTSNTSFDPSNMIFEIEVYDTQVGQTLSDGSVVGPITIHIASDSTGFVAAGGSIQSGMAYVWFQNTAGTIYLQGSVSQQTFSGTISYVNDATGSQVRSLGNFSVPTCGFFHCN